MYNLLQAALAALSKLFGLLDEQPQVAESEKAVPLPESGAGELTFEAVTFGYDPAVPVLHGVDLTIPGGDAACGGWGDRCGEEHAGQAGDQVLRPGRRASLPRRL